MENPNADVFVYTGEGGLEAPRDVVRVMVDPSVTSIPTNALRERKKLTEVELCEGLVEIGEWSFGYCNHSITNINIPNTLRRIKDCAFGGSLRTPIRLHDGIESIGEFALAGCIFTNFRVPPLITVIPEFMLSNCRAMCSLELSENMREIRNYAFQNCSCLRNVAFPSTAVFGNNVFMYLNTNTDLQRLFGSEARIIRELQHRFDRLPIHKLVYYQSYHEEVLQKLIDAMNTRSGQSRTLRNKLDPTGNHQDCLGMTPLHILACSSVHNPEVYRVMVEKYPTNLIAEDRWGALPLLYAFWGAAPVEIIQFLLTSYKSLYPGHVFNWTIMVTTMGRCDTPKEIIENLLCVRQLHFPEQPIDWEYLLNELAIPSNCHLSVVLLQEQMHFLFMCVMAERVEALPFKVWRDCIYNMIQTADYKLGRDNSDTLNRIREKLAHFEDELPQLKDATTILELTLWNMSKVEGATRHQKIFKTDESSFRRQCRINCGADVVIQHVLPFLL